MPGGGKAASLQMPIRLLLHGVTTPFQVSSFDGVSNRKSFEVRSTPELANFCARLDAALEPLSKQHNCSKYASLLKEQKGDYPSLFRMKVTIDCKTGKSPTKFFEAGTKRRLSDEEILNLDWKDCTFHVLLWISSVYVNAGTMGPIASPECIVVRREDAFPSIFDDECAQLVESEM